MIVSTPSLFDALAATPVLAGIDHPALLLLADEGSVRDFAAGEIIVREGDAGHSFFILVEGAVDVIKHFDSPHAVVLNRLCCRSFFGEMSIVEPMPRVATVCAIGPVKVIEVKAATLHHLFQKMPGQYAIVLLNIARDMARRLRSLDEAFAARAS